MHVFQIVVEGNTGSTGTMAESIGKLAISKGFKSTIAYGRFPRYSSSNLYRIGNWLDVLIHVLETRILDRHGLGSRKVTNRLVNKIKELNPDVIHLHHLHGYYINIEVLFQFLKSSNIPVVWTFHDCWSFTGHCAHFDYVACSKWLSECNQCPQKFEYPRSWIIDRSRLNFRLRKKLFIGLENMHIVTPSKWLENLTKLSFLRGTEISCINNGVDNNVFRPVKDRSALNSWNLPNSKFLILGVASPWTERKGFLEFIKLSHKLGSDMQLIMVGLSRSQINSLPTNIIGIEKTERKEDLVRLYSIVDVFLNLTLEDTFPTTNLEALSSGTPVITYDSGGSPEAVSIDSGIIVKKYSIPGVLSALNEIRINGKYYYSAHCRKRAKELFNIDVQLEEYFKLYFKIICNGNVKRI